MFVKTTRRHGGLARPTVLPRAHRGGFTLIEAAIATVVIGMGVVTLMHAMGSGTRVNGEARDITHAVFLSQEIREWTLQLPFTDPEEAADVDPGPDAANSPAQFVDDLDDLMDYTFTPPRDGQGEKITEMSDWSQEVQMEWRDPLNLSSPMVDGDSDVVCVTVTVRKGSKEVLTTSWMVTRRNDP